MLEVMIDLQGLQTESRFRGIGRSISEILNQLIKTENDIRWHFLINSALYETVEDVIHGYKKLNSNIIFHPIQILPDSAPFIKDNIVRNKISEQLYALYVDYINPDIILILSMFEGFIDDSVVYTNFLSNTKKIIIIHDFIPILNPTIYFDTKPINYKNFYLNRLSQVGTASAIFVISDSVVKEVNKILPDFSGSIKNISSGVSDKFRKIENKIESNIKKKYKISNDFILYTGGYDERKNISNLLTAYSIVKNNHQLKCTLVLCGPINDYTRSEIISICKSHDISAAEIVITGHIDDCELVEFYNEAALFVFPSWHEGFGLPALEAIRCGTLVLASNMTSLPEVVGTSETLFDPFNPDQIAGLIMKYFLSSNEKITLIQDQYEHSLSFDWANTSKLIIDGLKQLPTLEKNKTVQSWQEKVHRLNQLDEAYISKLKEICNELKFEAGNKILLSNIMSNNRLSAEGVIRRIHEVELRKLLIEGPYDSNYSLALVNRFLALELTSLYPEVRLNSSDGGGDYVPSAEFMNTLPQIQKLQLDKPKGDYAPDMVSRCMYPPRCFDMKAYLNSMHCYAWEETGFPIQYVREINRHLQFMTVVSHHVRDILINNGVNIPIKVVGNGVDHYLSLPSKKIELPDAGYTFLHVSSCFPRKGIDVLIRAYFEEFQNSEDVLLVIKTSRNPHNEVEDLLKAYAQGKSAVPKWHLSYDDLDPAEINYLYERGDCFVAPSRAEGFGLPFAEAKLKCQSLITTKWGGALDFCSTDDTIFVDYQFAESKSHLQLFNSMWAEPDLNQLKTAMRSAYNIGPAQNRLEKVDNQRKLLSEFTWRNVALKVSNFAKDHQRIRNNSDPRIGFVSTIFKRCGIATYAQHLINYMGGSYRVYADYGSQEVDQWPIKSTLCWQEGNDTLEKLKTSILHDQIDIIVVQFNYGFFDFSSFRNFLLSLIALKKTVIVELHATVDPKDRPDKSLALIKDALAACDRVIVHDLSDMNRLKALDIVGNVALVPHGLLHYSSKKSAMRGRKNIKIASYGFFLPDKGLIELIEAFTIAADKDEHIELFMYNAEYPAAISRSSIDIAQDKIRKSKHRNRIYLDIGFHSDEESFKQLSDADIIVYPYQQSNESASGAVRYGIAAGALVLVTPLSVFSNVTPAVTRFSGFDPICLSNDILKYSKLIREKSPEIIEMKKKQASWAEAHSYLNIGYVYKNMLQSLFMNKDQ